MLRKLWKWLAATFSVVVILLAIGIGLFRLLLPMIPRYHERIEAFASEAAGTPVRIERIAARWGWSGPELRFENARLFTATGGETLLRADEGRIVIDLGTLLGRREFRAGQVQLDGLQLEVVRDAQNRWHVGGRQLDGRNETTLPRLSLGLRKAQVVFRDELTGAGPGLFKDVELDVELRAATLTIETDMRLPPDLGRDAELSLQAQGELADFDNLDWQLYLRGDDLQVFGWQALMPAGRVVPTAGRGDVVLWFGARGGNVQQLNLQTDLRDLQFSRDDIELNEFDLLRGRFEFDRQTGGWQAAGSEVVVSAQGETWPAVSFAIEQAGNDEHGLFYADLNYARLDTIAPLLDWIPDTQLRERATALAPRGVIEDLSVRVIRRKGQSPDYSVRGRFDGLGFEPLEKFPGFERLGGEVRIDDNGGQLDLAPRPVRIAVPDILGAPLATKRLSGTVVWRRAPGEWRVLSNNVDIDHPQFLASTDFELTFADGQSPELDLRADLSRMKIDGLRGLLPEPVMRPQLFEYLNDLMVAGDVPSATVTWQGALDNFPFDDGSGEFRAVAEVRNATVNYGRGWPVAEEVNGTMQFRNASFTAGVSRAKMAGSRVSSAELSIADMRNSVFEMHTVADGLLDSLHTFIKQSPVARRGGDLLLKQLSLAGDGSAQVDLELPVGRKVRLERKMDVSVIVSTEAGQARLAGIDEPLEQISGSLRYRNGEFSARDIGARLLGAPVSIDVMTDEVEAGDERFRATIATARGTAASDELARFSDAIGGMLEGRTPYTATVVIPDREANRPLNIGIATRLEGMAVTLPQPFTKRAAQARDLVLDIALPSGGAQTDATYGDIATARLNWLREDDGWRFERGGLNLGTGAAELPDGPGLAVTGKAQVLDLGGMLGVQGGQDRQDGSGLLRSARVQAERLDAFGERLRDATLSVDRSEREWLVQIDSATASGALFVPFALDDNEIIANMQVLHIATGDSNGDPDGERNPRDIPAITLQADDFRLGDMQLGRLQARLVKDADGIVLEEFATEAETFRSSGKGLWEITQAGQRTQLEFDLQSSGLKATLADLGFQPLIDAGEARVIARLNWPGAPGGNFRERLNGEVAVRVGTGQIDTVEPGAGRALGLLSFTALPRRLSLDFRDVFDKGFGFDYIEGDFKLDNGDAFTSNLVLEGPAAQVGIAGRTGLAARDYDQSAVVYGNFGSALPVAGAIAGGPVGGAAMLIFSELFKRPLQNLARVNYRITGSWDDPAIERVFVNATEEGAS